MMKKVLFMLAMLTCIFASCSDGGSEDSVDPTPKPDEVKYEISIDASVISNGLSFNAKAGEGSISFTTNANWTLTVASTTSGATWCKASATSGTKGSATVKFTVEENTGYEDRSVSVTIKAGTASKTFTITQKAVDALLLTTGTYEVAQEGGTIEVEVKANIDYSMEISEMAKAWISDASSRALKTYKHTFNIAANEEAENREGEITFKSGDKVETVKVYQTGGAIIMLTQDEYIVSDAGEMITVEIKSNIEFGVQMPDVDWIVDEASSRGMSSHTLNYYIEPNEGYDSRSAEIIFFDKNSNLQDTLKVIQAQKDAIVISKTEYTIPVEGGTIDFEVSSNVEFNTEISVDWIKQVTTSRGLENKQLHFTIDENTELERGGTITFIYGDIKQVVNVWQEGEEIPYLTFTAESPQAIKIDKYISSLEYSVNDGEWKKLGTASVVFGGEKGGVLRLRGKSEIGTDYGHFIFGNSVPVSCSGDIRTLIDYEKYKTVDTSKAVFVQLFYECECLIQAPDLPATTLAENCYGKMFEGCTSLVKAPALPATTLAKGCYNYMFDKCTSLVETPALPATTLVEECYSGMFHRCYSLVEAPALPATKLAKFCYQSMFGECYSLVKAPDLPATALADYCYSSMFYDCISLVEAPKLPATTLADYCYDSMFMGCSSLVEAPELPATTLADHCYSFMFWECSSLIKAPELPATKLANACYGTMFWDCISLVEAPALPATTLVTNCYSGMFRGCSSLVEAPELPATTLVWRCYSGMFEGCSSLVEAPELPATTLADYCYAGMFKGCSSLVKTFDLPATVLAECCYQGMFSGCSSLVEAPALSATTLAGYCCNAMFSSCNSLKVAPKLFATKLTKYCYYCMFAGCSSLNEVTMLATDISATDCLTDWLYGVFYYGTLTKAWNMVVLPLGSSGVPSGWTVVDYEE